MIFLAGLTILNKERCLGIVGGCGGDPVVDNSKKGEVSGQIE